jgi:cytochrome c oxidase assembly factor 2
MSPSRVVPVRLRRAKTFTATLFAITFAASVLTVAASNVLPCPANTNRRRYADSDGDDAIEGRTVVVHKRPGRWIEERPPSSAVNA